MNSIDWLWLGLTFLCIILELVTSGIFFILFAVGTLAAFVYALVAPNITGEVLSFAIITLVCLLFLRPVVRRWLHLGKYGKDFTVPDYIEQNVGREGVVTRAFAHESTGQIRVGSEVWTARSLDGATYAVDDHVRVIRIEGVTALVEGLSQEQPSTAP